MIDEIKIQCEKGGARAVLARIKALRSHEGDEPSFWNSFAVLSAMLCRSPIALILEKPGDAWLVTDFRYCDGPAAGALAGDPSAFLPVAARANENGFAYERHAAGLPNVSLPFLLVVLLDCKRDAGCRALCLVADKGNAGQFNDVLVRADLISDIPGDYYAKRLAPRSASREPLLPAAPAAAEATRAELREASMLADLVDACHAVMKQRRFQTACSTLVHEVAQRLGCSRVGLGWRKGSYLRLAAVSHLEEFSRDSAGVQALEAIFEETVDQETAISVPSAEGLFVVDRAHRDYLSRNGLRQVVSLPLYDEAGVAGVLVLERQSDECDQRQLESLCLLLELVSPWLGELRYRDAWIGGRAAQRCRRAASGWFSAEGAAGRIGAALLAAALALTLVVEIDYKIEGTATLSTDSIRFFSAPFDGVIREVLVREGETVRGGDRLVSLDTRELLLKRSQETADISRYAREADKSRAQDALADMKIAQAKVAEMKAELERTDYNLQRATLTAVSDGVVVEGDSKKLLGAPVAKGDVLMKIARVEGMYASIKIRERDVEQLRLGMPGRMLLLSQPGRAFAVTVDKIIPQAEVDPREGNVFVLKASFDDKAQPWWRPGMSGLARIDAGRRSVAWLLTHRIVDFLRMHLWW